MPAHDEVGGQTKEDPQPREGCRQGHEEGEGCAIHEGVVGEFVREAERGEADPESDEESPPRDPTPKEVPASQVYEDRTERCRECKHDEHEADSQDDGIGDDGLEVSDVHILEDGDREFPRKEEGRGKDAEGDGFAVFDTLPPPPRGIVSHHRLESRFAYLSPAASKSRTNALAGIGGQSSRTLICNRDIRRGMWGFGSRKWSPFAGILLVALVLGLLGPLGWKCGDHGETDPGVTPETAAEPQALSAPAAPTPRVPSGLALLAPLLVGLSASAIAKRLRGPD